jgi:hypothetical protein
LWSNDDSKEKRNPGELWAERSNGRCLFIHAQRQGLRGHNCGKFVVRLSCQLVT